MESTYNKISDFEVEQEELDDIDVSFQKIFDPALINIETKTPSLDTLIKRIDRESIQMNTDKYFQRKDDLWDKTKQSRLIESILIRFPLPAFFFDSTNDSNWLVVDGLQRLSSIRNFCVNKTLRLTNLEFLTHLNGSTWDDIDNDFQRIIEESQVVIYKILPGTPTDVKFNIFKRINTGGLVLESQEIRHALFQGKPAEFIANLAACEEFKIATSGKIRQDRMLDRDFANRFLSFYLLGYKNYKTDLDTYMSRAMASINNLSDSELQDVIYNFKEAMKLSYSIFKEEAFRKVYKYYKSLPAINKALFDAISTQFALLSQEDRMCLKENATSFKKNLRDLLNADEYFFTSISNSTGNKKKIIYRHEAIKGVIEKIIH
jgi:hypothetical protein